MKNVLLEMLNNKATLMARLELEIDQLNAVIKMLPDQPSNDLVLSIQELPCGDTKPRT